MKNINNKIQTLKATLSKVEGNMTLRDYVENERSADPSFMRFLLDDDALEDFGGNATEDQEQEYQEFLSKL
jgi:hypothetical protein